MRFAPTLKALVLGWGVTVSLANAQLANFPARPVKIVVPTSPGSGSDTTARYVAEQLAAALGQPVVIDNKPDFISDKPSVCKRSWGESRWCDHRTADDIRQRRVRYHEPVLHRVARQ